MTEDCEIDLLLREHIPELLPIKGRRLRIYYHGIPKLCNNCYVQGHIKRACKEPKVDWTQFVSKLLHSGHFEEEMFGSWIQVLNEREAFDLIEAESKRGRGKSNRAKFKSSLARKRGKHATSNGHDREMDGNVQRGQSYSRRPPGRPYYQS